MPNQTCIQFQLKKLNSNPYTKHMRHISLVLQEEAFLHCNTQKCTVIYFFRVNVTTTKICNIDLIIDKFISIKLPLTHANSCYILSMFIFIHFDNNKFTDIVIFILLKVWLFVLKSREWHESIGILHFSLCLFFHI